MVLFQVRIVICKLIGLRLRFKIGEYEGKCKCLMILRNLALLTNILGSPFLRKGHLIELECSTAQRKLVSIATMSGTFEWTLWYLTVYKNYVLNYMNISIVVTNPNDSNDPSTNNILTCNYIVSTMTFKIFEIMEDTSNAKLGVRKEWNPVCWGPEVMLMQTLA